MGFGITRHHGMCPRMGGKSFQPNPFHNSLKNRDAAHTHPQGKAPLSLPAFHERPLPAAGGRDPKREGKGDVPFTLTEIVWRMLPILLEARQEYSPESSSDTLEMRRALLKFSILVLPGGSSPPFLYHMMSGAGLRRGEQIRAFPKARE